MTHSFDSVLMDYQELDSLQPQIKRHEISSHTVLDFFFSKEEIKSAAYLRLDSENETVPFYLIRLHSENHISFAKKLAMKKIFKTSNTLRQKQYRALIEFGLFHDEIMECLAESQYDFETAIYKLLQIKMDRASQMHVLCTTFAHEQVIYAMENSEDWFEVPYKLMWMYQSKHTTPSSARDMDQTMQRFLAQIARDNCSKLFHCLCAFGFTPQSILDNFLVCENWSLLPYNMLNVVLIS